MDHLEPTKPMRRKFDISREKKRFDTREYPRESTDISAHDSRRK